MESPLGLTLLFFALSAFMRPDAAQTPKDQPRVTTSPKLKFSFARYWNGCGITDELLSGITFTTVRLRCSKRIAPPIPPFITVQFFDLNVASAPVVVTWGARKESARASRCVREQVGCDEATGGTIDFGESGAHGTRPPSFELRFADGSVESGSFTTALPCQRVICN
jgi:hypothetical protein